MPNLFSTFGRAALVALGLAVAPAAFADADFTFSCPTGFTPIFTGGGTQSVEATCGIDCGPGFVATANGNSVTCSQGAPVDTPASGCSLDRESAEQLRCARHRQGRHAHADLHGRHDPTALTLTWRHPGRLSDERGHGERQLCVLDGVNQTKTAGTTFQVKSAGGGGTNSTNRSATFNYQQAAAAVLGTSRTVRAARRRSRISIPRSTDTPGDGLGGVGTGAYFSIKMTVPSNANTAVNLALKMLGTYGMTGASATWAISETACDVDTPILDMINTIFSKNKLRYMKGYISPNIDASYNYGPAGSQGNATTLSGTRTMEIGKTYYFNIKVSSCPSGYCTIDSLKLP